VEATANAAHHLDVVKMNFRLHCESDSEEIQSLFESVFGESEGQT